MSAKIYNQRELLRRYQYKRKSEDVARALVQIHFDLNTIPTLESMESLRGLEGHAASLYFGVFGKLLLPDWVRFERRVRRPPTDPVNALLSFGYTLLMNELVISTRAMGLDPYLGALHGSETGRPNLVLDLMEEWRPVIVDTLVLIVLNKGILQEKNFSFGSKQETQVLLNESGRKQWFRSFESRMHEMIFSPLYGKDLSYREILRIQCQQLHRCFAKRKMYVPFLSRGEFIEGKEDL